MHKRCGYVLPVLHVAGVGAGHVCGAGAFIARGFSRPVGRPGSWFVEHGLVVVRLLVLDCVAEFRSDRPLFVDYSL